MSQIIATASFRRSDNKEMIMTGDPIYNASDDYIKDLVRVGLVRECSVRMAAPEIKEANFPLAGSTPPSASLPAPPLQQTIAKPFVIGETFPDVAPKLKKKPGRKKKS